MMIVLSILQEARNLSLGDQAKPKMSVIAKIVLLSMECNLLQINNIIFMHIIYIAYNTHIYILNVPRIT